MRNAHETDHGSRASDPQRRRYRVVASDAFGGRVCTDPAGQLQHGLNRFIAAPGDDVRRAELSGNCLAGGVAAEGDDAAGTEALGRQNRAQPNRAIPDDCHRVTALTIAWCPVPMTSDRVRSERRTSSE